MTQITVDAKLSEKLTGVTEPTELCDPAGRPLGRFVPLIDLSKWKPLSPDISPEELERRRKSNEPRSSLSEIIARLEKGQ